MEFIKLENGFQIKSKGEVLLSHTPQHPMIYVGYGQETVEMYRGNFDIEDYVVERYPLKNCEIEETNQGFRIVFDQILVGDFQIKGDSVHIFFENSNEKINRFWFRISALEEEKCYGCGEQMSYFNLRGRSFPLWTSEPGVGRDKSSYLTWLCDVESKSGGDYYNTNFPQPTFLSSRKYFVHVDSAAYGDFNFKNKDYHELQLWEVPKEIRLVEGSDYPDLLKKLTDDLGRQPLLPDWIYNGLITGLQGGTKRMTELVDKTLENGIKIAGVWIQDWEGKKVTSFGKRLRWNWQWDEEMYPGLPEKIKEYEKKGIRLLGYINPYLLEGTSLYNEGKEKGYFAVREDGSDYLVDFGEFYCGVVDFTNPEAYEWFKENIKRDMIQFGLSGWMADFGEYLPTDLKLYSGADPMIEHNNWPARWAKCNYDALKESGKLGEIVYFMRAGGTGSQKYCTLLWAGDQSVDFSIHDGLASVIVGALSAGISGCGLHHSDIGGYTSLFDNCRTREVFERWAEMAAFTPVMRTHEGNRPETNFQYYENKETMALLARMTDIHIALKPYLMNAVRENSESGLPVQRPLFVHYENDPKTYDIQTEYLLGRDLLVAPVYLSGKEEWEVYLPDDAWIHLWTGKEYGKGSHVAETKMGFPAVFYRKETKWRKVFEDIYKQFGIS